MHIQGKLILFCLSTFFSVAKSQSIELPVRQDIQESIELPARQDIQVAEQEQAILESKSKVRLESLVGLSIVLVSFSIFLNTVFYMIQYENAEAIRVQKEEAEALLKAQQEAEKSDTGHRNIIAKALGGAKSLALKPFKMMGNTFNYTRNKVAKSINGIKSKFPKSPKGEGIMKKPPTLDPASSKTMGIGIQPQPQEEENSIIKMSDYNLLIKSYALSSILLNVILTGFVLTCVYSIWSLSKTYKPSIDNLFLGSTPLKNFSTTSTSTVVMYFLSFGACFFIFRVLAYKLGLLLRRLARQ